MLPSPLLPTGAGATPLAMEEQMVGLDMLSGGEDGGMMVMVDGAPMG